MPSSSVTGLTAANNVAITGGSATGLTNIGTNALNVVTGAGLGKVLVSDAGGNLSYITAGTTGQVLIGATGANPAFGTLTVGNVTGAAATADLAEDLATANHITYKNSAGNITNVTLGSELVDTAGTLTVRQVASFPMVDVDADVTVALHKKGYSVPQMFNGAVVSSITCAVADTNGASADNTIVNLVKYRAGVATTVFTTGANMSFNILTATASDVVNATVATLNTGDIITPNVTAIAGANAPHGLSCSVIFAH